MTLQQLKYIIKVVECGSITEAARHLFISQPSLSMSIKEIETEYKIILFYRTTKGISITPEGSEFLSYARQIIEQAELMEQRYLYKKAPKQLFSISTQHYAFAVSAFVNLIAQLNSNEYEFTLRETRTYEIIEDVAFFRSELGIIYFSNFNEKVLKKLLIENHLTFIPLFNASPHVFISVSHPLAERKVVSLHDLDPFPCLSFEQGTYNSFCFAEELLSTTIHKKEIHVSDRATLFNLLIGLNGYTISSGILNSDLNGDNITSIKLDTDEIMCIGYISNKKMPLSTVALNYINELKKLITDYGYALL